jgi:putative ABC transport system permease protein
MAICEMPGWVETKSRPRWCLLASPRWRKVWADAWTERGRLLALIAAIAVSLMAVGNVLGAYAILSREIVVNYLGTRPASATLELAAGVDAALLDATRARPEIAEAEARDTLLARVRVGEDWRPLLLFVVDDFQQIKLNSFRPQSGAWPPPAGSLLIERAALGMVEARVGDKLRIKAPHGPASELWISGTVHDPGLAPAWQERMAYGYLTRATAEQLGEPPVLHELRIAVRGNASSDPAQAGDSMDREAIVAAAKQLGHWLQARGLPVHEIRVPAPGKHPHQIQMVTIVLMLLVFALLALVLSSVLMASALSALLARQVREIGVMKSLGARNGQIAALYLVLVLGIGLASCVSALLPSVLGARELAGAVSRMLNFELTSRALPLWVFATELGAGIVVPLLVASLPIARASRASVRDALDRQGVSAIMLAPALTALPLPLRNALRRPGRLALTLLLLACAGAMFMTALDVKQSWLENLDKFYRARHYDLEVRLQRSEPIALAESLRRLPGVRSVETWGYVPTSFTRPGEIDVSASYPDLRHASFALLAPPPNMELMQLPLLAGRWLSPGDDDAVVLNHGAKAQAPELQLGDRVTLSIEGSPSTWRLAGIVEEVGSTPTAYVSADAFARLAHTGGRARLLRVATSAVSDGERTSISRAVEGLLERAGASVEQGLPLSEHKTAVGDHILILIRALLAMSLVMATVGSLGLASTLGVSVTERTRELGVMKALGANARRVLADLVLEALAIGTLSAVLAFLLSLPLSAWVDHVVGKLGFLAALPFAVVPEAALGWLALVLVISLLATLVPGRRAAELSVREALAHV